MAPDGCDDFDYVLTMGEENYRMVASLCQGSAVVRPFLDFAKATTLERGVPDPFYDGSEGFEHVLNLVEEASEGLLEDNRERDLCCRD